jgi:wyosine [tRNA(Phe)-imidazoG37] synthetase (radical SAM superfamily)
MPLSREINHEVGATLDRLDRKTVDVITFSGTGEPTLNPSIGEIESKIRDISDDLPIVLLTNASLLPKKEVRRRIEDFDIITAKYDAGDEDTFKRINRPAKGTFTLQEIHNGIKQLQSEIRGILALEVMLLRDSKGFTNVEGSPRSALIEGVIDVNPDIVQIYTPWRPSSVQTVKPVSNRVLQEFGQDLEDYFGTERLWIYGVHDARDESVKWKAHHVIEQELFELLKRRPCRILDISISLGVTPMVVTRLLKKLQSSENVRMSKVESEEFYELTKRSQ